MMERLEVSVLGRVQLVMYRDFAARKARGLGLVGTVQNIPDGTVRVIAEGSRKKLDAFVLKLREGSLFSKVEEVQSVFSGATGEFEKFCILY